MVQEFVHPQYERKLDIMSQPTVDAVICPERDFKATASGANPLRK